MPVSIRSSWGGIRSGKPVLPFQVSPSRYTQSWADPEAASAHPRGCTNTWLSVLGPWRWHALGHAAGLAPFRSKCSRIFFVLVIYKFFSSLNLLICLLCKQIKFTSAVAFPASAAMLFCLSKGTSLGFPVLVLFCLRSHFMTAAFLLSYQPSDKITWLMWTVAPGSYCPAAKFPAAQTTILFTFHFVDSSQEVSDESDYSSFAQVVFQMLLPVMLPPVTNMHTNPIRM